MGRRSDQWPIHRAVDHRVGVKEKSLDFSFYRLPIYVDVTSHFARECRLEDGRCPAGPRITEAFDRSGAVSSREELLRRTQSQLESAGLRDLRRAHREGGWTARRHFSGTGRLAAGRYEAFGRLADGSGIPEPLGRQCCQPRHDFAHDRHPCVPAPADAHRGSRVAEKRGSSLRRPRYRAHPRSVAAGDADLGSVTLAHPPGLAGPL